MQIIGKYHDYYDIGLAYGQDPTLIFNRDRTHPLEEDLKLLKELKEKLASGDRWKIHSTYDSRGNSDYVIGFCGKLYKCVDIHLLCGVDSIRPFKDVIYTRDELQTRVFDKCKNRYFKRYIDELKEYSKDPDKNWAWLPKKLDPISFPEFFIENNIAIFSYKPRYPINSYQSFVINPALKKLMFPRILDPYSAFAELSMFLGGVLLRPEKDIVEIDDKHRLQQKGFDEKYGFRTRPKNKA